MYLRSYILLYNVFTTLSSIFIIELIVMLLQKHSNLEITCSCNTNILEDTVKYFLIL